MPCVGFKPANRMFSVRTPSGHINSQIIKPYVKVNVKVKSLCFNWAPHHEGAVGEWRHSSTHYSTSVLDGGEWSASRPGRFTPTERAPGTHWIGGRVSPRAVLDAVVKRKIPSPRREWNSRTPIVQPVAQTTLSSTLTWNIRFTTSLHRT
jgi:hypothetical protein